MQNKPNIPAKPLKIVADSNVWGAKEAFSHLGNHVVSLAILHSHDINTVAVNDADILIVRSSTKVNEALLKNSHVRFVGTATIGDDHIDKAYLGAQGIALSTAAGSSTESVVEYMLAALFYAQSLGKLNLASHSIGIVGVGRIGTMLNISCQRIGMATLINDPPRVEASPNTHKDFKSLVYLLKHADVLTLHTPLVRDGQHPTVHLIGKTELNQFKGKGIINAGRGVCVDNHALLDWLNEDAERFAILDCWEQEPAVNLTLLNHPQTLIATPHIAGHSLDGKAMNTFFVYKDLCDYLKVEKTWNVEQALPPIPSSELSSGLTPEKLAQTLYPITNDSQTMKKNAANMKQWFQTYRKAYPIRRSWKKMLSAHSDYNQELFF